MDYRFISPEECSYKYLLTDDRVMINVGSVGQPRDGDPRACYVILEDKQVTFRRIEYPVEETRRKIYAIDELDNMLGDRLLTGR
jgi:diadenosine tetraphosphatase ApaH/serine/threonine PP2A family protein phosphatase